MDLPRLTDIAWGNVPEYKVKFDSLPDADKDKANRLKNDMVQRTNMRVDALERTFWYRFMNSFEVFCMKNGLSFSDFLKMPFNEQSELYLASARNQENLNEKKRRLDYCTRYENGLQFIYSSPSFYRSAGKAELYGDYCVIWNKASNNNDVALMHDSLDYYYDANNSFDQTSCEHDMLPCSKVEYSFATRYEGQIISLSIDELEELIDFDDDYIEIVSTAIQSLSTIKAVIVSSDLWLRLDAFENMKRFGPEPTDYEYQLLNPHLELRRELMSYGLNIISESDLSKLWSN